jgi:hypothetical protein
MFAARPRKWSQYVHPKRRLTFNRLHGVIRQKTAPYTVTAGRTANPKSKKMFVMKLSEEQTPEMLLFGSENVITLNNSIYSRI